MCWTVSSSFLSSASSSEMSPSLLIMNMWVCPAESSLSSFLVAWTFGYWICFSGQTPIRSMSMNYYYVIKQSYYSSYKMAQSQSSPQNQ
jgi:hypothetical protein